MMTATRSWGITLSILGMLAAATAWPFAALMFFATLGAEDGVKLTSKGHELKYPEGRPPPGWNEGVPGAA